MKILNERKFSFLPSPKLNYLVNRIRCNTIKFQKSWLAFAGRAGRGQIDGGQGRDSEK